MRCVPLIFLLLVGPALPGCGDMCRLQITNEIADPADASLNVVEARLEGTTYWGDIDLLEGRIESGETRGVKVQQSAPFTMDVRVSDSSGRSWTRLDAISCDAPTEELEVTFTDADRDQPCTWTATNDTDTVFRSLRLRRAGTVAWAREILAEDLELDAAIAFGVDEDDVVWDLQAVGEGGDTWTQEDLGPCVDAEPMGLIITGPADAPPEIAR